MNKNRKKTILQVLTVLLTVSLFACMLSGCGLFRAVFGNNGSKPSASGTQIQSEQKTAESVPTAPSATPAAEAAVVEEPEVPPEKQSDLLPYDKAAESFLKIYDDRVFDESLDLAEHPGLLSVKEVTGPFLRIQKGSGDRFIPDLIGSDIVDNPELPDDVEIVPEDEDFFPKEYLPMIQTREKIAGAAAGKQPVVYAVLEYLGYRSAGEYGSNGDFVLYYHVTRVSFYSMNTGEMLGWMTTSKSRTGPWVLMSNQYASDGQHSIYKFDGRSIWSDTAWTNALDELFYDDNGYQIVGTTLLSVPENIGTIRIPDGVTEIAAHCGGGANAVQLIIPEGVEKIGYMAFSGSNISTVSFPSSLYYCDEDVLSSTPWQEDNSKSDWVIVGDGILLYCNDDSSDLVVPGNVRYIAPGAINNLGAKTLTIPSTVIQCCGSLEYDYHSAISYMEHLEKITFEGGLQEVLPDIELSTFTFCDALETVVVNYDTGELPDHWISTSVDKTNLTIICPDDSPAAQWADSWNVPHSPS